MHHDPQLTDRTALVVDLDRSLTVADVAMESLVRVARRGWRPFFQLMWMMLTGRAVVKTWLARHDPVDADQLPLRGEVIDTIMAARRQGRAVILASAAHHRTVARVARATGLFDHIIASRHNRNLKGLAKLAAIRAYLGDAPFDYIGDSAADRPIWAAARTAYTVGVPTHSAQEQRLGPKPRSTLRALIKAARPHQWAKNALVFVPLATAGLLFDAAAIGHALIAFACLSVLASSVYILNDMLDIDADRAHATKCQRPLASGTLPIPLALAAAVLGTIGALIAAALFAGPATLAALLVYYALTVIYSFKIKAAMIADVMALACLYAIRLVVGSAAIGVAMSSWLILFAIFFFLSLGYLKRYIELLSSDRPGHQLLSGRGYVKSDTEIVAMSGLAAGMASLLVIALFADAMRDSGQYHNPALLWLLVLPLLYWLNRVWMMARRGEVDGDPVAFAIRDRRSVVVGAMLASIMIAAKFLPPTAALSGL